MKIWELKASLDERFETLQLVNFDKDYEQYFKDKFNTTNPLLEIWGDVKVFTLDEGESSDCPYFWGYSAAPVFSERALGLTKDFLRGKAETLPLVHPVNKYFAIHVLNTIDAIDYDRAVIRQLETGLRVGMDKYAFIPEKIEGQHIFRIYIDDRVRSMVFVSDEFKKLVESNKLVGFEFIEVWDSNC
ncbi:imm11 family protein [Paenactinomyces guangxiensis]|uniref:Immunity MXAN-0049 protein domain-containing protein n=1 Tax=Paenactinomyces guangxiensis TaxID=1490290 RepID=A0A7W2A709_9BACL|nr:DUF1629 domain-containing protein [Paenactinomyces guangxiensis]MBA4494011.1 hypothetical protein [Paenactinomyces guangxiensis]MBH8591244.1 hypothetical protein [Paenactinomyces guangxiensis]